MLAGSVLAALCFLPTGCLRPRAADEVPSIEFTKIPATGTGGPKLIGEIAGRVKGARPGQRLVLYAYSGVWWVQPFSAQPITQIQADSTWKSPTHMGTEYAALLVDKDFIPASKLNRLPGRGGQVSAVAMVKGHESTTVAPAPIQFGGYAWDVRRLPSDRGGVANPYSAENAWTDAQGMLHLRISKSQDGWACAEVNLQRSLGYGSYVFVVKEVTKLEPATVLGFFTWDDQGAEENNREIDIEISRWGDASSKNTQFAIQPYYVPVNVVRFATPGGRVTYSFRWEPGRVSFKAVRGVGEQHGVNVISQHVFTSGVPSPGSEAVHLNLYVYGKTRMPQQNGTEVVIEKFEYLP
ncbi:glycoside hydrolase family 16 protein [uncultured Paludibaculum sp.]|uniref:glycoside hydrolase family 16 protein n=1 Tax=uncultured Paludibaculum sp. TaxID=1765020 RepID=UPI002AAC37FD|nr:glycoside hydrolase family 16 protein [uncultured Paludibaculum sp.]